MRIAVIGARGFVGRRVLAALGAAGVEASPVDRLDRFDAVIDARGPGHGTALARRCLGHGVRLIDCSAHPPATRELLALEADGPGAIVVGAGLFPGISNLLAARDPTASAVLVELDPFSGAGAGTIDSLTGALAGPAVQSVRVDGRAALAIDSSDAAIAAAGGRRLQLLITTRQRWLARLLPLAAWLGRRRLVGRLVAAAANLAMKILRVRLLARRPSAIALYTAGDRLRPAFSASDGFAATARAIAWAAVEAARRPELRGITTFVDLSLPPTGGGSGLSISHFSAGRSRDLPRARA